MELYEALKSGTSAEDLETTFREQLKAAQTRILKEKEKEEAEAKERERKETELTLFREELAQTIYNYAEALFKKEDIEEDIDNYTSVDEIKNILIKEEKELVDIVKITKKIENTLNSVNTIKKVSPNSPETFEGNIDSFDDDIIKRFLGSLR